MRVLPIYLLNYQLSVDYLLSLRYLSMFIRFCSIHQLHLLLTNFNFSSQKHLKFINTYLNANLCSRVTNFWFINFHVSCIPMVYQLSLFFPYQLVLCFKLLFELVTYIYLFFFILFLVWKLQALVISDIGDTSLYSYRFLWDEIVNFYLSEKLFSD